MDEPEGAKADVGVTQRGAQHVPGGQGAPPKAQGGVEDGGAVALEPDVDREALGGRGQAEVVAARHGLEGRHVEDLVGGVRDRTALRVEQVAEGLPEGVVDLRHHPPQALLAVVAEEEGHRVEDVAEHPQVCAYFDLPIQHASNRILKRMGRHYTRDKLCRLFRRIREIIPGAVLRTTVILGFPGETDQDFQQVMDFAEEIRFDHLGVFVYSDADDLASHRLRQHVPQGVAQDRYDQLMSAQMDIAAEKNQKHIGRTFQVLIEEDLGNHLFAGRTCFQAPEVDGVTYVNTGTSALPLPIGCFARARINDAMEYDLMGEVA